MMGTQIRPELDPLPLEISPVSFSYVSPIPGLKFSGRINRIPFFAFEIAETVTYRETKPDS